MISRVAILGTGLLGTSVGLALRESGFKGTIVGWNRSAEGGETSAQRRHGRFARRRRNVSRACEPDDTTGRADLRHFRLCG